RYTSPSATSTSGSCQAAMPCKIGYAINNASAGDHVVVTPGAYTVKTALQAKDIDVYGQPGQAAPQLTSAGQSTLFTLEGGTLRHLALRGLAPTKDTLLVKRGLAEDLEVVSEAGNG